MGFFGSSIFVSGSQNIQEHLAGWPLTRFMLLIWIFSLFYRLASFDINLGLFLGLCLDLQPSFVCSPAILFSTFSVRLIKAFFMLSPVWGLHVGPSLLIPKTAQQWKQDWALNGALGNPTSNRGCSGRKITPEKWEASVCYKELEPFQSRTFDADVVENLDESLQKQSRANSICLYSLL